MDGLCSTAHQACVTTTCRHAPFLRVPLPAARLHCRGLSLAADVDLAAIAASCHGYSGADLAALTREAAMHAFSTAAAQIMADGEHETSRGALWLPMVVQLQQAVTDAWLVPAYFAYECRHMEIACLALCRLACLLACLLV